MQPGEGDDDDEDGEDTLDNSAMSTEEEVGNFSC